MLPILNRLVGPLFVLVLAIVSAEAFADPQARAVEAVRKMTSRCDKCLFFALPTQNPLIAKHTLFVVSTLDRIPPPFWSVALPEKGDPLILETESLNDWNRMISRETVALGDSASVENYVKAFLDLAVGKALFVPKLLPGELARVQKKRKQARADSLQIHRQKKLLSISFYAKDIKGALQRWDLLIRSDGTILKTDLVTF